MTHLRKLLALLPAAALAIMLSPHARADAWNQKIEFTFSQPVEIPGQVLNPGTYVFKLMNSLSNRSVVEVFNKNETHCYGMFQSLPDYHLTAADKPLIYFGEQAAGAPPAIRAWFYPGYHYGHAFVYPKSSAESLARANHQQVTAQQEMTAPAMGRVPTNQAE